VIDAARLCAAFALPITHRPAANVVAMLVTNGRLARVAEEHGAAMPADRTIVGGNAVSGEPQGHTAGNAPNSNVRQELPGCGETGANPQRPSVDLLLACKHLCLCLPDPPSASAFAVFVLVDLQLLLRKSELLHGIAPHNTRCIVARDRCHFAQDLLARVLLVTLNLVELNDLRRDAALQDCVGERLLAEEPRQSPLSSCR